MKRHRLLIYCLGVLLMSGCDGPGQSAGVVTKERPYGVHVARERSVYQAQKIQARLRAMGVAAYLVASVDSLDRCWYNVMSGAFRDSISCAAHALLLDSTFRLPHLRAVDVRTLADSIAVLHSGMSGWGSDCESRRIGANVPKVFSDLSDLAQKFPADNMFYLGRISIANFAVPEGVSSASKLCMDLPRGISLGDVAEVARSMVEVQYQDNLYDDRVTLSVAKLRRAAMGDGREAFEECGVARPTRYVRSYAIALNFSRRILNAGDYANGRIEAVEYSAYRQLLGYRVGLMEGDGEERTYSIVVDSECGYLFMAQSEHKDDGAMRELFASVGRGGGLERYDEFHNTYYLLPDDVDGDDLFLGCSVEKLDCRYAQQRQYAAWAKAMVGHWCVGGYFLSRSKGFWEVGIFDLLTPTTQGNIYDTLYAKTVSNPVSRQYVYGVQGHFVKLSGVMRELNFGFDRYVCAIVAEGLALEDYIDRAERMQFARGGYKSLLGGVVPI